MNKINEQELENAAGGYGYDNGWILSMDLCFMISRILSAIHIFLTFQ